MATIHDSIPGFELYQPSSLKAATDLLAKFGEDAWPLAGGLDSMDWFKDRAKRPSAVIDLSRIDELHGIREVEGGGFEIGALATLTEIEEHPGLQKQFSVLTQAAGLVATPQIRNQGTLGGNLCQDTRCWYYRGGWPCYRAGGNICYADTPTSMNREHAIFGASRCVAVNPSDTAPALLVLDAQMVIQRGKSQRVVAAKDFFVGPAVDITRMTVLRPDELLVAVRIPAKWAGATFYFEKIRDRQAWDFALVSVASALRIVGGQIREARLAVNGVAPVPMRLPDAEKDLLGQVPNEVIGAAVGETSVWDAKPLAMNGFKVSLMRNLIMRSIRGTEA